MIVPRPPDCGSNCGHRGSRRSLSSGGRPAQAVGSSVQTGSIVQTTNGQAPMAYTGAMAHIRRPSGSPEPVRNHDFLFQILPATRSNTTSPFQLLILACATPVVSSTFQEKATVSVACFAHLNGYNSPRISESAAFCSGLSLGSNVITTQDGS